MQESIIDLLRARVPTKPVSSPPKITRLRTKNLQALIKKYRKRKVFKLTHKQEHTLQRKIRITMRRRCVVSVTPTVLYHAMNHSKGPVREALDIARRHRIQNA